MGVQKLVRDPKEMMESGGHKASFQSPPDWPRAEGCQPKEPICSPGHLESGKPLPTGWQDIVQANREKKNHLRVGVAREGEGHGEGEGEGLVCQQ